MVVQVDDSPREPSIVKDGKMKGKGAPKSTIFKKDEEPAPVVVAPIVDDQAGEREYLKEIITDMEREGLSDDTDVIAEIADQVLVAFGFGNDAESEARKWFKENGFDYDKYNQ